MTEGDAAAAARVRALEAVAARAWPAPERCDRDGWLLRAGPEGTWRTRSVLPQPPPATAAQRPLDERIHEVEAFYAERGLPARFQIHDAAWPDDLDDVLAARGYERGKRTHVLAGPIDTLVANTRRPARTTLAIGLEDRASPGWIAALGRLQGFDRAVLADRSALFARIEAARLHARADGDAGPLAVGFAVCDAGLVGLFSLVTAPSARRSGVATALVHALLGAARERGAREAYLQVEADNAAGCALYARCGFVRHHGYHYRTRSPDPDARRG